MIVSVTSSLPSHKSPGPNGLPNGYYRRYSNVLSQPLKEVFNHCMQGGSLPVEMLLAHVSTLPKPGISKDQCKNFRPISLLNCDAKIYAKLVSERLAPLLNKLVHNDQSGFVRGRQGSDNSRKVLNMVAEMERGKLGGPFLALD
ncbi:DUF1725 domain-containing [Pelobates cultripes]|uniref:DUF1725 domain-containing n=1 Tax=Pelobates cultripes TaxID=61616 RepID=A0AAD1TLY4_PELCU|nr:DUF1725 domain-containing [Pelobates cultripes]